MFFARRPDGAFLARRRPPHGLLASTVELPGTPWTSKGPDGALAGVAPVVARWRRLPGEVEQVFTHFALRLTVYAAEFDGEAPAGCFWVAPDAVRRGGILEHDAEGGRARPGAILTPRGPIVMERSSCRR